MGRPRSARRTRWTTPRARPRTPDAFVEVTPSDPGNLKGSTWSDLAGGDILADVLADDGASIDPTWTVRYNDLSGGPQQARFVQFDVEFQSPPDPTVIDGTDFADLIYSTGGVDIIDARGGDDVIFGRGGDDEITGGAGDDLYSYSADAIGSADLITDFLVGNDSIDLDTLFDNLGATSREVQVTATDGDGAADDALVEAVADGAVVADFSIALQDVDPSLSGLLDQITVDDGNGVV